MELLALLDTNIKELERIQDDPHTMTMVRRRLGNIVMHMKQLRDDLTPQMEAPVRAKKLPDVPNATGTSKAFKEMDKHLDKVYGKT